MFHPVLLPSPKREGLRLRQAERAGHFAAPEGAAPAPAPAAAELAADACDGTGGGKPPTLTRRVRGNPGSGKIGGTSARLKGEADKGLALLRPSLTPRSPLLTCPPPESRSNPERTLRPFKEPPLSCRENGVGLSASDSGELGICAEWVRGATDGQYGGGVREGEEGGRGGEHICCLP